MRDWSPRRLAEAANAELVSMPHGVAQGAPSGGAVADAGRDSARFPGPVRAVIDSRDAGPGDLFVGLKGEHVDGGRFGNEQHAARRGGGERARRRARRR